MTDLLNANSSEMPFTSRRRGPRVLVRDTVTARVLDGAVPEIIAVRDLGFRGFAIETASAVPARTRGQFEFSSAEVPLFSVDAVAVHCFRQPGPDGAFVSGWEFRDFSGLDETIEKLMYEAVGVLTIE